MHFSTCFVTLALTAVLSSASLAAPVPVHRASADSLSSSPSKRNIDPYVVIRGGIGKAEGMAAAIVAHINDIVHANPPYPLNQALADGVTNPVLDLQSYVNGLKIATDQYAKPLPDTDRNVNTAKSAIDATLPSFQGRTLHDIVNNIGTIGLGVEAAQSALDSAATSIGNEHHF